MEKLDVIKFIKAQIDTEMAKLKDARHDDMYAQGKILAYTWQWSYSYHNETFLRGIVSAWMSDKQKMGVRRRKNTPLNTHNETNPILPKGRNPL